MKEYEKVSNYKLMKKQPVILWVDGRAFHTFTRGLTKPFDRVLNHTMTQTMQDMVDNIQNAKIAYTQSDEIAIILADTDKLETSSWLNYRVQKMASMGASMATMYFNDHWKENVFGDLGHAEYGIDEETREWKGYWFAQRKAMFDCRVFNLPEHEVENWLLWRQQDFMRNSVQMFARSIFSHNELHGRNTAEMKKMCFERGQSWEKLPVHLKYGTFATKVGMVWPTLMVDLNRDFVRRVVGIDKHEWDK